MHKQDVFKILSVFSDNGDDDPTVITIKIQLQVIQ